MYVASRLTSWITTVRIPNQTHKNDKDDKHCRIARAQKCMYMSLNPNKKRQPRRSGIYSTCIEFVFVNSTWNILKLWLHLLPSPEMLILVNETQPQFLFEGNFVFNPASPSISLSSIFASWVASEPKRSTWKHGKHEHQAMRFFACRSGPWKHPPGREGWFSLSNVSDVPSSFLVAQEPHAGTWPCFLRFSEDFLSTTPIWDHSGATCSVLPAYVTSINQSTI